MPTESSRSRLFQLIASECRKQIDATVPDTGGFHRILTEIVPKLISGEVERDSVIGMVQEIAADNLGRGSRNPEGFRQILSLVESKEPLTKRKEAAGAARAEKPDPAPGNDAPEGTTEA